MCVCLCVLCVCVCVGVGECIKKGSYSTSHRGCCNLLNLPDRKWIEHNLEVGKGIVNKEKCMAQSREGEITDKKRKKEQERQQRHRKRLLKCGKDS